MTEPATDPELRSQLADVIAALGKAETELAALRQVARGYCPHCGRGDAAPTVEDWEQQRDRANRAEEERDGAYRERAQLLGLLAALHPSVIAPAPDVDESGWQILYLRIGGRQASWHIAARDADLYTHVEHVPADDRRAQWDGHTTEEKYAHIGQFATRLYAEARGRGETLLMPAEPVPAATQATPDRLALIRAAADRADHAATQADTDTARAVHHGWAAGLREALRLLHTEATQATDHQEQPTRPA
ncbi:hypothetical protein [Streptomyces sp. NPDC006739]|uniref:hypothetical protein n=1 Tax=Streptomyces sp. NPDC006739 TaxID=3364763 RepID=UPI0036C3E718